LSSDKIYPGDSQTSRPTATTSQEQTLSFRAAQINPQDWN